MLLWTWHWFPVQRSPVDASRTGFGVNASFCGVSEE